MKVVVTSGGKTPSNRESRELVAGASPNKFVKKAPVSNKYLDRIN